MLALESVHVAIGGREVLRGVDLAVADGRTLVLVGPSGSGKSTVLRAALGLVRPSAGKVLIDGAPLDPQDRTFRHRIGYVIQEGGLFPHLTVRGNVTLMTSYLRWSRADVDKRLEELLALTRLDRGLLERFPGELSGGQRQRVGLMRAMMLRPQLLLLDEPLGALDPIVRSELQDELLAIFRALGTTVVLVTHDLAEAAFFADRLAVMEAGGIAGQGTVDEILAAPQSTFVGRFVHAQRATHLVGTG